MTKPDSPTIPWEHARRKLELWSPHHAVQVSAEAVDTLASLPLRSRERVGRAIDSLAEAPDRGAPTPEDPTVRAVQVPPCVVEYRIEVPDVVVLRIRAQGKKPVVLPGHYTVEQVGEIAGWRYPRARRWVVATVPVRRVGNRLFAPTHAVLVALLCAREGFIPPPRTVRSHAEALATMPLADLSRYFRESGWRLEGPDDTVHVLRRFASSLAAEWRREYPPRTYCFPEWVQRVCEEKN